MKIRRFKSVAMLVISIIASVNSFAAARSEPHQTHQTTVYRTGDDGTYQTGVPLKPAAERFSVNGNLVTDSLTGLMWTKNGNLNGTKTWADATNYCETLVYEAFSDWRLPNVNELVSLTDYQRSSPCLPSGHPFISVQSGSFWSSSTLAGNSDRAWYVHLPRQRVLRRQDQQLLCLACPLPLII